MQGIAFRGVNTSLLDGFDVGFTKLLFNEFLGAAVEYYPFPDTSSLCAPSLCCRGGTHLLAHSLTRERIPRSYVGLRNDECDVAAAAVELEPGRASCPTSCPSQPLPDLPGSDYELESYRDRLDTICCLEYGVPHLPANGFALFSKAKPKQVSLVNAILSVDLLNAATPIVIAVVLFGWLMYMVERRDNKAQFHAQHSGVYFACVSIATFGFGDLAPVTRVGRLLTVFWCVMSVMSVSALTSVISARLTVDQLAHTTVDSLAQLRPSEICVENAYPAVESFVSDSFALGGDLAGAGVTLGTPQECVEAVLSGDVVAYLSDQPLLSWLACVPIVMHRSFFFHSLFPCALTYAALILRFDARSFQYLELPNLYVSQTIRANPLTLAYPSGSLLRPLADTAVIRMNTDTAWYSARQRLESAWFPRNSILAADRTPAVNVGTLAAACVLVFVWLAGIVAVVARKALRAARGGQPLSRVSTRVNRLMHEDDAEAGNGDAAAAQREEAGRAKDDTALSI